MHINFIINDIYEEVCVDIKPAHELFSGLFDNSCVIAKLIASKTGLKA